MKPIATHLSHRNALSEGVLLACLQVFLTCTVARGDYALTWSAHTAGGGHATGGVYALISAVGSCATVDDSSTVSPPTPNPMEWATAPYATSPSAITMMAAEAHDPSSGVQYYFQNITVSGHDSGWQDSRTYTDINLSADTSYQYQVKARGLMRVETEYSATLPARTPPVAGEQVPEGSAKPVSGELGNDLNLQVDSFTGSVSYAIPIALPPARQGSEPALTLRYGGGGNGWCGVGWSLGMGAIQRDTRKGVPVARSGATFLNKYDDTKGFVVAFGAVNSRLVHISGNEYRAEIDQAFLKYEYDAAYDPNGLWTVTDKSGNKFYFGRMPGEVAGTMAGGALRHPQFTSTGKGENVYLWALAKIEDINGNLTYIYYTQDAGQVYLSEIRYNGHEHGPFATTHSVQFLCEDRDDKSVSYATGHRIETKQRLKEICVNVLDKTQTPAQWVRVRSYHLTYENSPSTLRSLLKSVKMCGTGDPGNPDSYLPPVTFDYQQKPFEFDAPIDWGPLDSQASDLASNSPMATNATSLWHDVIFSLSPFSHQLVPYGYDNTGVALCDLNGDGLPDRVLRNDVGFAPPNNVLKAQFSTGSGFTSLQNWGPIDAQGHTADVEAQLWNSPRSVWTDIFYGFVFSYPIQWDPPVYQYDFNPSFADDIPVDILDINGDGLPDRVMRTSGYDFSPPNNTLKVQFNTGSGYTAVSNWGPLYTFGNTVCTSSIVQYDARAKAFNSVGATYNGDNLTGMYQSALVSLVDMNHDALPDRVLWNPSAPGDFTIQFNTGVGFESESGSPIAVHWGPVSGQGSTEYGWLSPRTVDAGQETMIDLVDINGDGLPDRVMRKRASPFTVFKVQFNTGCGFEKDTNGNAVLRDWGPLSGQGDGTAQWNSLQCVLMASGTLYVDFFDINGDGLPDRVMRERTTSQAGNPSTYDVFKVQLNTGNGFQKDTSGVAVLANWTGIDDQGAGPSYPDWASPHGVHRPERLDSDTYVTMCDINGDGLPDRVMRKKVSPYNVFKVQLNKGPFPDLLSKVTGKLGGSVQVVYKSSTDPEKHKDASGVNRLPFPVQVASLVDVNDGFGNHVLTQYEYARGFYNAARREFGGFGLTTIKEVKNGSSGLETVGTKTMIHFHQGGGYDDPSSSEWQDADSVGKKGTPYRIEVYDRDERLHKISVNKVEEVNVIPDRNDWHFAYIAQTTTVDYNGVAYTPGSHQYPADCYRAKLQQWEYDTATGNLRKFIDLGQVSLGTTAPAIEANLANHTYISNVSTSDDVYADYGYATFANPAILNKIRMAKTTGDPDGEYRLTQTFYSYDPNGRLLTEVAWLDREWYFDSVDVNLAPVQYGYDAYGNRNQVIDQVGIETTTTYDPNYHTFPVETATGSFVSSTDYDIRSGLPVRTIDPTNMVARNEYDSFFRLTDVMTSTEPNGTPSLWQTHLDYSLGGIAGGISHNYVHQVHEGYEAYIYSDGFGRIVQTRLKAETGAVHEYRVTGTTYNELGKLSFRTLPFFADGAAYSSAAGQVGTLTEYDALGRAWKVTPPAGESGSPTGSATTVYGDSTNPWAQISKDAEGKTTKRYFDAAGRTVQLVEVTSGGDVVTNYRYDRLGRLTKTTDHAGHEFKTTYDSLGRKARSTDPDLGTWYYLYDDAGRLVGQDDARCGRIWFSYEDELGRVSQKRVYRGSLPLVETITYTYDQSDDPAYNVHKGQVYKVTDGQGWTKTGYDARGRAIKSTRHVNENNKDYTTQTSYDRADRVTQIVYPDAKAVATHTYDFAGHLTQVESLWGTGANEVFYQASAFNEDEQPTITHYGNGVSTQTEFYTAPRRLRRTHTSTSTANLQDITYTYDKLSNLKSAADAVHTGAASCSLTNIQYDDLHRLTSLSSAAQGNLTYEYDALGNIHTNTEMGTGTYTYSTTQPHAVTAANGNTCSYDACGNMITRNRSGQPNQTLTYDEQNRLTQVTIAGGSTIWFGYTADGARLWKKVNSQITDLWIGSLYEEKDGKILCHVYAGGQLVATFEPQSGCACLVENNRYLASLWHVGDKTFDTLFGGGHTPVTVMWAAALTGLVLGLRYSRRRLFDRYGLQVHYGLRAFGGSDPWRQMVLLTLAASIFLSSNPEAALADGPQYDPVFYYYHADHLGSSQILTDRAGHLVQQYGYSPFGRDNGPTPTPAFPVSNRYTGQILDEDTGLYYYAARYYDPELARFIQPDSVIPDPGSSQALNRYTYCYNNPLRLTDPTGNYPYDSYGGGAGGAFMGAYMGALEAGMSGGDMLMGAYVGAINGAVGQTLIQTASSNSNALTSLLTGNTTSASFAADWEPYDFSTGYSSPYEVIKPPDYSAYWGKPLTYDYASGPDTLAGLEQLKPMEITHAALNIAGTVDPTPVSDTLNAVLYAGEGRWGDAATSLLGVVPYLGDMAKGGRFAASTLHFADFTARAGRYEAKGIHYANDLGVQSFNQMYRYTAGTGLQRHHLIEQRFSRNMDFGDLSQLSVAMTREQHQVVTNLWRDAISYGAEGTGKATRESVLEAAADIYRSNPEILKSLGL